MFQLDACIHAIQSASKGKRKRRNVQRILSDPVPTALRTINQLKNGTWKPSIKETTILREGAHKKERKIQKPSFDNDQIVHHMLMSQFKPIVEPKMYEYSCGSIPKRGSLMVMKKMRQWIKEYQDKEQKFYVAELDIKKFYQNVDVEILKNQLKKLIKDDIYLHILFQVIDSTAPGLPLGYYTSPWLGNWYLTPLDRHIIHTLHPDHYIRYMDNLWLFSTNSMELHEIVSNIQQFCSNELHVQIKDDWQVFQFEDSNGNGRAINCLGYVIHHNRVTLRKKLLQRIRAKALRMHKLKKCRVMDARAMLSYSGWLLHTDTYNYYLKWIKPNVSFHYCKIVSKRGNYNDRLEESIQQYETRTSGHRKQSKRRIRKKRSSSRGSSKSV